MKDSTGWYLAYMSARLEQGVEQIALNGKPGGSQSEKLLATALTDQTIYLWSVGDEGVASQIGLFSLSVLVDALFFIGGQLVALSKTGQVGIWHGMTQNWQVSFKKKIVGFVDEFYSSIVTFPGSRCASDIQLRYSWFVFTTGLH